MEKHEKIISVWELHYVRSSRTSNRWVPSTTSSGTMGSNKDDDMMRVITEQDELSEVEKMDNWIVGRRVIEHQKLKKFLSAGLYLQPKRSRVFLGDRLKLTGSNDWLFKIERQGHRRYLTPCRHRRQGWENLKVHPLPTLRWMVAGHSNHPKSENTVEATSSIHLPLCGVRRRRHSVTQLSGDRNKRKQTSTVPSAGSVILRVASWWWLHPKLLYTLFPASQCGEVRISDTLFE